ncbi:MAG: hypothetical protein HYZ93_00795 [Candidatus Omnitrophica bacterium]|nr:hypothetical protein [Candidatus Omnitrophota bacterium]
MDSKGVCVLAMVLSLCPLRAEAAQLKGSVRLKGPVPAPEVIPIQPKSGEHSTQGCGSSKISQRLLVDPSGGLANAVVWLEGPPDPLIRNREPSVLLDQRGCEFLPHVLLVPLGGELKVRNSDPIRHNLRIFREGQASMLMHRWQAADAPDAAWNFKEPGRYVVRCGIHPWMHAWVVVTPHRRAAVTDSHGQFLIPDAPAGRQTLHVWHETLGTLEVPVQVKSDREILEPIHFVRKEA